MVHLTKIYTKTGDKGGTSIANGMRVNKISPLIEAIGSVDEANSAIGMIKGHNLDKIQNDLFDLGAELSGSKTVSITQDCIDLLENNIDALNSSMRPLNSFILPKGEIHNARAIVRRAERDVWFAIEIHSHNDEMEFSELIPVYLNRLSDYLFVLARFDSGQVDEKLWKPLG